VGSLVRFAVERGSLHWKHDLAGCGGISTAARLSTSAIADGYYLTRALNPKSQAPNSK
jgi:hypothetical protein